MNDFGGLTIAAALPLHLVAYAGVCSYLDLDEIGMRSFSWDFAVGQAITFLYHQITLRP